MKRPLLFCILFAFMGCAKFDEPVPIYEPEIAASLQTRAGAAATFATLPDPFALTNMQAVYNTLYAYAPVQLPLRAPGAKDDDEEQEETEEAETMKEVAE